MANGIVCMMTECVLDLTACFTDVNCIETFACLAALLVMLAISYQGYILFSHTAQVIDGKRLRKEMSTEMLEIFSNLNEGIIVVQNQTINFTSLALESILKSLSVMSPFQTNITNLVLDLKVFRLYKNHDEDANSSSSIGKSSLLKKGMKKSCKEAREEQQRLFSLKDIMQKSESII